ncbi:hypothetical protein L1987_69272 [Smallanthus sonchifolius]|uniref:Uncharacterized protein n=1 Tax=Smallanthus sonchifolius TaxID=185202 RepID=A0ACB9B6K1_9ASTR|nr:hypothetical protein L1987_69272 [Smallanthus sonchifolius]
MSFICGFSGNQEDDLDDLCILPSTPQRRRPKDSKNPYSNGGLDKFEALLADLDGKRQMIYTKKGSEDIWLVRFGYSNSNDVKSIVVKVKDHRKQEKDHHHKLENVKTHVLSYSEHPGDKVVLPAKTSTGFDQLIRKFGDWWKPWYSLPLFVILILVLLALFGRSFAILFTCIGWYTYGAYE